jgi:hypothetical protein
MENKNSSAGKISLIFSGTRAIPLESQRLRPKDSNGEER